MSQINSFLASLSNGQKYHGGHPRDESVYLRAGNLHMVYQKGSLRHISDGEHEIIRMIYSAVRDKDWLTAEPVLSQGEFDTGTDSFRISYDCSYRSGELDFIARYTIEGTNDGTILFSMDGEARNSFLKNRIGFCVLHPVEENAGRTCEILDTGNKRELLAFPVYISPDPPFLNIKSMIWANGSKKCRIDFSGDVFETEDQRNWTDASYKTYCTPGELPSPVMIENGTKIQQKVILKVEGAMPYKNAVEPVKISFNGKIVSDLPKIGIGRSSRNVPLSENEAGILRNLNTDHYRVDLHLFSRDWKAVAENAAAEASGMLVPLELALFFDNDAIAQAEELAKWISMRNADIRIILLYHSEQLSTPALIRETIPSILRKALPDVLIGSGTNANFAELNRDWPSADLNDLVCYSVHPQEHASDNETLAENLRGQGYTAESAMRFAGNKGVWISPVNIQRRFNANIEAYEKTTSPAGFPPQADSRLMSLFGAGWTAGSFKYLAEEGVTGITYYETAGERGIIQGDYDSRWPEEFASVKGMIFPVYHVLRYLLSDKSFKVIKSRSSRPLVADCLFLSKGEKLRGILMNFTAVEQKVNIEGVKDLHIEGKLDIHSFNDAVSDTRWLDRYRCDTDISGGIVEMVPYSVCFVKANTRVHD